MKINRGRAAQRDIFVPWNWNILSTELLAKAKKILHKKSRMVRNRNIMEAGRWETKCDLCVHYRSLWGALSYHHCGSLLTKICALKRLLRADSKWTVSRTDSHCEFFNQWCLLFLKVGTVWKIKVNILNSDYQSSKC